VVGQESQSELEARVEEQIQEVRQTDAAQLTFIWSEKYLFEIRLMIIIYLTYFLC
jgi:hypothetical protein